MPTKEMLDEMERLNCNLEEYCQILIDKINYKRIERTPEKAINVVRCKDCKHYNTEPDGWCDIHSHYHDDDWGTCFDPDDYCSYGETRTEKRT